MPKQNSAILLNRYVWLLDTIYSAGYISREEIDRRWCRSLLSDGEMCIPERTFHRYKEAIQELFQINIGFDKRRGYYIEDSSDIEFEGMRKWLVSTFAVSNLIQEGQSLRKNISFEAIPSGQKYLSLILECVRDGVKVKVTHQGFGKDHSTTFMIAPYCLKIFKQRWYVLAESEYEDHRLLIYGLDRFLSVERTDVHYTIPEDFYADEYFVQFYGVSVPTGKPQLVKLKVSAAQANYLRTLPLHPSQQELERNDTHSIFQYFLIPTYELRQDILSHGADWEVLSPAGLRNEIKEQVEKMGEMYK